MTWNTVSPEVSPESLKKNQNNVQFGLMLDFFSARKYTFGYIIYLIFI